MGRIVFAGVDIETTGLTEQHQVIQIGVALGSELFVSDVGYFPESLVISPEALAVNGFTIYRIMEAPAPDTVDARGAVWLDARVTLDEVIVPVGWNVGSFDLPFIRRTFPRMAKFFHSYRSVDLNSICFALGGADRYELVRKETVEYAKRVVGPSKEHDAGYDAQTSLQAFWHLQQTLDL